MKKLEALQELMNGKKVAHSELVGEYLVMNDKGQVVNDKNNVFNIQIAPDDGWEIYNPKPKVKTLSKEGALKELMGGEKIKAVSWDDNYIYIDKDGQIVDKNGDLFNFMATKESEWTLYVEEVKEVQNKALLDEIHKLYTMIEELKTKSTPAPADKSCICKADREEMEQLFYKANGSEVKELFRGELEKVEDKNSLLKVITKYIPYCWMGKRYNTAKNYYVDMRNIIKDVFEGSELVDIALDLFMIPSEVHDEVKKVSNQKTIAKINDRETFEPEKIKKLIDMLKKYIDKIFSIGFDKADDELVEIYKQNNLPIAKQQKAFMARANIFAIYLAFVTGRRSIEILKTLELVEKNGKWFYSGIAKKGQDNVMIEAVACDDIKFVKKVLERLRVDLDTTKLTKTQTNSKYNMMFNRSLKRITGTNYTFHDCREIYAELCYLKYGKQNGTEREELDYKASILGHSIDTDRLLATEHYMTMKGE